MTFTPGIDTGNLYQNFVGADSPTVYYLMEDSAGPFTDEQGLQDANAVGTWNFQTKQLCRGSLYSAEAVDDTAKGAIASAMSSKVTLTFELWFEPTEIPAQDASLIESGETGDGTQLSVLTDGTVELYNSAIEQFVVSTTVLEVGKTYHIVGVHNNAGGYFALYINGVEEARFDGAVGNASGSDTGSFGDAEVTGASSSSVGALGYYSNISGYTTALTPERILTHYQAGVLS